MERMDSDGLRWTEWTLQLKPLMGHDRLQGVSALPDRYKWPCSLLHRYLRWMASLKQHAAVFHRFQKLIIDFPCEFRNNFSATIRNSSHVNHSQCHRNQWIYLLTFKNILTFLYLLLITLLTNLLFILFAYFSLLSYYPIFCSPKRCSWAAFVDASHKGVTTWEDWHKKAPSALQLGCF